MLDESLYNFTLQIATILHYYEGQLYFVKSFYRVKDEVFYSEVYKTDGFTKTEEEESNDTYLGTVEGLKDEIDIIKEVLERSTIK